MFVSRCGALLLNLWLDLHGGFSGVPPRSSMEPGCATWEKHLWSSADSLRWLDMSEGKRSCPTSERKPWRRQWPRIPSSLFINRCLNEFWHRKGIPFVITEWRIGAPLWCFHYPQLTDIITLHILILEPDKQDGGANAPAAVALMSTWGPLERDVLVGR